LITDAGTPLISDPGFRLVSACHDAGIRVSPIPGPSAVTAALSVSGLPTDRFLFVGFPPSKSGARQRWYASLAHESHTLVIYESVHRIADSLADLASCFGPGRQLMLARELTKRFETLLRGSIEEVLKAVLADDNQQKGEFVLVVASAQFSASAQANVADVFPADRIDGSLSGKPNSPAADSDPDNRDRQSELSSSSRSSIEIDKLIQLLLEHMPVKQVARQIADLSGLPRKAIYARALELQGRT